MNQKIKLPKNGKMRYIEGEVFGNYVVHRSDYGVSQKWQISRLTNGEFVRAGATKTELLDYLKERLAL